MVQHQRVSDGATIYAWHGIPKPRLWSRLSNVDLAVSRTVQLSERTSIDIRPEVFNRTNTPPLGNLAVILGNADFGSITTAGDTLVSHAWHEAEVLGPPR